MQYALATLDAFTTLVQQISEDWNVWIQTERAKLDLQPGLPLPEAIKRKEEYAEFKKTYDFASTAQAQAVQYAMILFGAEALARGRREQLAIKKAAQKAAATQETLS